MREINASKARLEKDLAKFDDDIAREERRLEAHTQARRDEVHSRITHLSSQIQSQEAQLASIASSKSHIESRINDARILGQSLERQQQEVQAQIQHVGYNLDQAHKAVSDQYAPYGNNIQRVLQRIQQEKERGTWKGEVIGPLGLYVKARDAARWGGILRAQLGGLLMSFGCSDARDRPALKRILGEYKK